MRQKVREPTKGSVMILNARPEKGAESAAGRVSVVSMSLTSTPATSGMSMGEGRYATTASSSGCTPLFLKAVPHTMGVNARAQQPLRMRRLIVASSGILPSK